jgi:molybdopterin-guanine dinucleotide biosynthesis protein A
MEWPCTGECHCVLWKSTDGRITPLCRLSTEHLINILKMAVREGRRLHPQVLAEAKKRIDLNNEALTISMENPDGEAG